MKKTENKISKFNLRNYINFFKFINSLDQNDLSHLSAFLNTLSNLRTPYHINDFSKIHETYLTSRWNKRNLDNLINNQYTNEDNHLSQRHDLKQKEYKISSQNGEDGILLYLLSLVGTADKKFIDIGCGGITSNTYNLSINYGFTGLYIDGDINNINQTKEIITRATDFKNLPITYLSTWVTKENINDTIQSSSIGDNIDVLSIDIDGNDYWIWNAITIVQPRIVVIEYNASYGPELSVTIPYKEDFNAIEYHDRKWYHGASLKALAKLGTQKGYKLAGCDSNGVNAFFIREDVFPKNLTEAEINDAFYAHFNRIGIKTQKEQIEFLSTNFELTEI